MRRGETKAPLTEAEKAERRAKRAPNDIRTGFRNATPEARVAAVREAIREYGLPFEEVQR